MGIQQITGIDAEWNDLWCQCTHPIGETQLVVSDISGSQREFTLGLTIDLMDQIALWSKHFEVNVQEATTGHLVLHLNLDILLGDVLKEALFRFGIDFHGDCLNEVLWD